MTIIEKLARVRNMITRTRAGGVNAQWVAEAIEHIKELENAIKELQEVTISGSEEVPDEDWPKSAVSDDTILSPEESDEVTDECA